MTNLQSLSIFLTERLTMAAQEIYKAVEVTVSEYHDEISRYRHESDLLRRKLFEAGIEFNPEEHPASSILPTERSIGAEGLISDDNLQVKPELSSAKPNPELPLPREAIPEEPSPPNPCSEADRDMGSFFQPPESSSNPLLEARQCMMIKEEFKESKSDLETEIYCRAQTSISVNPGCDGQENEPERLSSMHRDPEFPIPTIVAGPPDREDHYNLLNQDKEQIKRRERRSFLTNKLPKPKEESKMEERIKNPRACRKKVRIPEVSLIDEEQSFPSMFQEDKDVQLSCDPSSAYQYHSDRTQCMVCGRGFGSRGLLKIHLRVHSGERPYHCPYCTKNFRQSSHLNVHVRIHTGEKPYTCLTCGKRYSDRSACNRHVKAHLENQ